MFCEEEALGRHNVVVTVSNALLTMSNSLDCPRSIARNTQAEALNPN
jgi:hypothetical protein